MKLTLKIVIILAIAFAAWQLVTPRVSIGFDRNSPQTCVLNNCRQLSLAIQQYYLDKNLTPTLPIELPTIPHLIKEGYLNESFLTSLTNTKGIYCFYLNKDSKSGEIIIEFFGEKGVVQMTSGGTGTISSWKQFHQKEK